MQPRFPQDRFTSRLLRCTLLVAAIAWAAQSTAPAAERTARPNVVVILADDLGFSDLGCYGGEIATPNLDRLAKNGLRFTQFYNTARCWPTRAALLTGYYAQQVRRDKLPGIRSGGRGRRPAWARLLPDMVKPLGYRAYHSGKWHIDGMPLANGFDRSYYLRDQGRFFSPRTHWEDDRKLPAVKRGSGYYATIAIADHAIKCLKDHASRHKDKPFFHYVAFTAPHFPLHALPEDIARYGSAYVNGWAEIRRKRWAKSQKLGIAHGMLSKVERDLGPPYHFPKALKQLGPGEVNRPLPWSELTTEQQKFQATKMSIHAAMIDRMDREIGRILDQLRAMKAFDNTLILFLSDNGASAEIMVRNDGHDPKAPPGSAATHLCLGPGWSTTCNTPFRRHKTWVHEGGICTPLIVHWPKGIEARGTLRRNVGHVIDIVPTILDVAGGKPLRSWKGIPVPKAPGKSLVPAFAKDNSVTRGSLWWWHEGNRAIRIGDWKLVSADNGKTWELFDLSKDRAETNDLSAKHPDKVRRLKQAWTERTAEIRKLAMRDLRENR
ncbi:MAG: arylsulfatase [Planctomycetaceae bacterium]